MKGKEGVKEGRRDGRMTYNRGFLFQSIPCIKHAPKHYSY